MAPINYAKMEKHLLEKAKKRKGGPEQSLRAYRSSLRKLDGNTYIALERFALANYLKALRAQDRENSKKAETTLKAFNKSKQKHGFKEAFERRFVASNLKASRRYDSRREWGISFGANLERLNSFYKPINLVKLIDNYTKKKKLKKAVVVELGAGVGLAASELKSVLGKKIDLTVTGAKWIPEWRELKNNKHISWKVAHAEKLGKVALPGTVDIIHSNLAFYHTTNPQKAFEEVGKLLKKRGLFVFTSEKNIFEKEKIPPMFHLVKLSTQIIAMKNGSHPITVYLLRKK
ncbi:MAG: class I SAM-dependent methyltransferase [archaeon]